MLRDIYPPRPRRPRVRPPLPPRRREPGRGGARAAHAAARPAPCCASGDWRIVVGSPHVANSVPVDCCSMALGAQPIHLVPAPGRPAVATARASAPSPSGAVLIGARHRSSERRPGLLPRRRRRGDRRAGASFGTIALLGVSMVLAGVAGLLTQPPQLQPGQQARPTRATRRPAVVPVQRRHQQQPAGRPGAAGVRHASGGLASLCRPASGRGHRGVDSPRRACSRSCASPTHAQTTRRAQGRRQGRRRAAASTTPHQPTEYPEHAAQSRPPLRILEVLSEGVVSQHTAATARATSGSRCLSGRHAYRRLRRQLPIQHHARATSATATPSQDPIPGYPIAECTVAVGVECHLAVPVVRSDHAPASASVRYIVRIPGALHAGDRRRHQRHHCRLRFRHQRRRRAWTNVVTERIYGKTMSPYQRSVRDQPSVHSTELARSAIMRLDPTPPSARQQQALLVELHRNRRWPARLRRHLGHVDDDRRRGSSPTCRSAPTCSTGS